MDKPPPPPPLIRSSINAKPLTISLNNRNTCDDQNTLVKKEDMIEAIQHLYIVANGNN